MKQRDPKDFLIAELREEVKQLHQENDRLNVDFLEKNDLVLAYQESVSAGRQHGANLITQERAEKNQWKLAYEQEHEKNEKLERENAQYKYQLSKYDIGFVNANDHHAKQPDDEAQEQKKVGSLWTSDYMN